MTDKTREKVEFDKGLLKIGEKYLVGIDEVGRGPLAGPVVCCAVVMPLGDDKIIEGIDDSKKLSEKKRVALAEQIKQTALDYCICEISPEEIDEINILQATKLCMKRCAEGINKVAVDLVATDALDIAVSFPQISVVKGDLKSYTIGAASILAKVYRDDLMVEYDKTYPSYCFAKNKGYGTKDHIKALKEIGSCPIHRKTFIKNFSVK